MNYSQAIHRLFGINLFGGMKLSLDNSLALDKALQNPNQKFPSIHVAGTNGKGSVTKKIATGLEKAGYKVGLYTSPHISCFRERIRINEAMISESATASILTKIFSVIDAEKIDATYFEIATILAFAYFAQENVDFAVIETGLGGRFDATNIIKPRLSVITSISLDHTEVLGTTIEEIAREKAGIIKSSVPVILGPRLPHSIFQSVAKELNSPCISIHGTFCNFEEENNAIAEAALKEMQIPKSSIEHAFKGKMPCRMELIPSAVPIILDVAHNPDGLDQLFRSLRNKYPNAHFRVVCGLSKNKDIPQCLKILMCQAKNIHLVEATNGRGASVSALKNQLLTLGLSETRIFIEPTISETLKHAMEKAKIHDEVLVVCGTFFIMKEARAALGIQESQDLVDMNERR